MVDELRININDGEEDDDSKGSESGAMSDVEKLKKMLIKLSIFVQTL